MTSSNTTPNRSSAETLFDIELGNMTPKQQPQPNTPPRAQTVPKRNGDEPTFASSSYHDWEPGAPHDPRHYPFNTNIAHAHRKRWWHDRRKVWRGVGVVLGAMFMLGMVVMAVLWFSGDRQTVFDVDVHVNVTRSDATAPEDDAVRSVVVMPEMSVSMSQPTTAPQSPSMVVVTVTPPRSTVQSTLLLTTTVSGLAPTMTFFTIADGKDVTKKAVELAPAVRPTLSTTETTTIAIGVNGIPILGQAASPIIVQPDSVFITGTTKALSLTVVVGASSTSTVGHVDPTTLAKVIANVFIAKAETTMKVVTIAPQPSTMSTLAKKAMG